MQVALDSAYGCRMIRLGEETVTRASAIACFVAVLGLAGSSAADGIGFGKVNSYAQFTLGAALPNDLEISASTPSIVGSGAIEFDTGFAASVAVGYYFANWLALEAEAGYAGAEASGVSGTATLTGPPLTIISGTASVEGDIQTLPIYVNAMVRPQMNGVFPYVGGGVGGLWYDANLDSVAGVPVRESHSDFVFAAHADAGVEFDVGSHILMGIRYRYTWVNSSEWIFDDETFHEASVTFRMPY